MKERIVTEYNKDKVNEMVLALLYLTSSHDQFGTRAWKGLDWEAMERLHKKGYIGDPKGKSMSVVVTAAGEKLARELFFKYFEAKE